ncbi:hypothetical protein PRIPAC_76938 [Pristionchus pacificus]|uniref:Uncharacterized protein n=1 Tax=Pristionchus pacificus TaxID=54126 RepID=A0A2A6BE76_PRIPA|nr:hypothetical protein PRIPAC_76938 [Pristionchus pacificus]|eukprot:PDM64156.1 hypothetical protein PRIPAC_54400 [Pristionchus pacificus]
MEKKENSKKEQPKFILPDLPPQVELHVPTFVQNLKNQYKILTDDSPLPQPFDYFYSLNSYYWRTVTIVCLRLGERMGRTTVAHSLLSTVFYPYILILMTYLLLPIHLTFIHIKHNQNSLPVADRRLLIMFYSFLMGSFSSHLLIQWIPNTNLPHPFFIPAIVGVMIQLAGPSVGYDRKLFLLSTVGVAGATAVSLALFNGKFGVLYLLALAHSIFISTFNLQCLVDGMRKGDLDMEGGIIKVIIILLFTSSIDKVLWGRFEPDLTKHYNVSTSKLIINTIVF